MNNKLHLLIVSDEGPFLDREVDSVTLQTTSGMITLLKDHQPLLSQLQFGELTYQVGTEKQQVLITQGFVNKKADNQVLVIVDSAFSARELSDSRIQTAISKAKEALKISKDKKEMLMLEASLKQLFWELQLENKKRKS